MKFSFKRVTSVALSFAIVPSSLTSAFSAATASATATSLHQQKYPLATFDDEHAAPSAQAAPNSRQIPD